MDGLNNTLTAKITFGLKAQGHFERITHRIKKWLPTFEDPYAVWDEIGKEIGWVGWAVCENFVKRLIVDNEKLAKNLHSLELEKIAADEECHSLLKENKAIKAKLEAIEESKVDKNNLVECLVHLVKYGVCDRQQIDRCILKPLNAGEFDV